MNNQYGNQYPNSNPYGNNQQIFNHQPNYNNQYPRPPPPPQNPYNQIPPGNYHPLPPQPNQGYLPPNQPYVQNQGFAPVGGQGFAPVGGQGFVYNGHMCPFCRRETGSIPMKQPGGVTWIWCFALFLCTGVCCCIPFCVDSCKDTVMTCQACQGIKGRIQANCC